MLVIKKTFSGLCCFRADMILKNVMTNKKLKLIVLFVY